MNNILTQTNNNGNQISKSVKKFFKRFHISSLLRSCNAYKEKGIPVMDIFAYLFMMIFSFGSMYMNFKTKRNIPSFGKDTIYRFMKQANINWLKFTSRLSATIINSAIKPLNNKCEDVFIFDDSIFERNRSKRVELLAKVYDHAKGVYTFGFRMLTLSWSDGNTLIPINSILLSSENSKNRINDAKAMDKRTVGYRRRRLSSTKATLAILDLLEAAKKSGVSAKYVLFDSWFTFPSTLHAIKAKGYEVIGMIKKTPKMLFKYNNKDMTLSSIYKCNKKRRGKSKYLLSVVVGVVKDGKVIPAKVVYVRNRSNRKEYLCIISTDTSLSEEDIIRIYGKRWDIEVFFKFCKSYLKLSKECRSLSFDAITAHTAIVFVRYMMLSLEKRENEDHRSLGEYYLKIFDELPNITFEEAMLFVLDVFKETFLQNDVSCDSEIVKIYNKFVESIRKYLPVCFRDFQHNFS